MVLLCNGLSLFIFSFFFDFLLKYIVSFLFIKVYRLVDFFNWTSFICIGRLGLLFGKMIVYYSIYMAVSFAMLGKMKSVVWCASASLFSISAKVRYAQENNMAGKYQTSKRFYKENAWKNWIWASFSQWWTYGEKSDLCI